MITDDQKPLKTNLKRPNLKDQSHLIVNQQAPILGVHDDVGRTDVTVQDWRILLGIDYDGLSYVADHLSDTGWRAGLIEVVA